MATEQRGFGFGTQVAAADLRTKQHTAVIIDAAGKVASNGVAGGKIAGILQNKPNTDEVADVQVLGVTKMVAGAAVAAGSKVASDATGRAIVAAGAGTTIIGTAFDAAAAAGEIITVLAAPCAGVV